MGKQEMEKTTEELKELIQSQSGEFIIHVELIKEAAECGENSETSA